MMQGGGDKMSLKTINRFYLEYDNDPVNDSVLDTNSGRLYFNEVDPEFDPPEYEKTVLITNSCPYFENGVFVPSKKKYKVISGANKYQGVFILRGTCSHSKLDSFYSMFKNSTRAIRFSREIEFSGSGHPIIYKGIFYKFPSPGRKIGTDLYDYHMEFYHIGTIDGGCLNYSKHS